MALTTQDKIGIGQIGLSGLQGLLGGMDNEAQDTADQRYNQSRDDEFFAALLQALQNQSGVEQDITTEQLQRSLAFSNANPLGAEQNLQTKGAAGIAGLDMLQGRKLGGGQVNNAANVNTSNLRQTLSPEAAQESIRQRRIATAGLDPRAAQEIGGAGSDYASRLFGDLQASQGMRRDNAQSAYDMIGDRRAQIAAAQVAEEKKDDGPGFWKKLGGALIPAAGLAANFIPGVGPLASMAIGAASGAAGGALLGGKKGALAGAGLGTAGAAGLNQLPSQKGAPQWQGAPYSGPVQGAQPSITPPANFAGDVMKQAQGLNTQNAMGGLPATPNMNSPRGLSPSTLASPNAGTGFGRNPNQFNGPYTPQFDFSKMMTPPSAPQQQSQQQPLDIGRFADAKVGGYGAPMNQQASVEYGKVAGPAMNTAPLGVLLGGGAMAMGSPIAAGTGLATTGVSALQRFAPQGSNFMQQMGRVQQALSSPQRLLGGGQNMLGPGVPKALLTQNTDSAQRTVAQLMEAYQKHLAMGNKEYAQQVLELAQPFLKGLK